MMRLWTLQTADFWATLQQRGRARATWRGVDRAWRPAYAWMAGQMVLRGVCRRPVPPLWAWHSCGSVGRAPGQLDVDLLWPTGRRGVKLELRVPDPLLLLSDYAVWNEILDQTFEIAAGRRPPGTAGWDRVFAVNLQARPWGRGGSGGGDIQACLPYLDRAWVRRATPVRSRD